MRPSNQKPTTCRSCGVPLPPGTGARYSEPLPYWPPNYQSYACDHCAALADLYLALAPQLHDLSEQIRYTIYTRMPDEPLMVLRFGMPAWEGQVAYTQAAVRSIIESSGPAAAAVARYLAHELDHSDSLSTATQVITLARQIQSDVLNRVSSIVLLGGSHDQPTTQNR